MSLSARRAWIEILTTVLHWYHISVALRKESVDRNAEVKGSMVTQSRVALRKESVDRNAEVKGSMVTQSRRSPQGERG